MLNESMQVLILLTGAAGQIFVARRNISGFYFWIFCNVLMIETAYTAKPQQLGNLVLYLFYVVMCFYSIYRWKQYDKSTTEKPPPYDWDVLQFTQPAHPEKRAAHRDAEEDTHLF